MPLACAPPACGRKQTRVTEVPGPGPSTVACEQGRESHLSDRVSLARRGPPLVTPLVTLFHAVSFGADSYVRARAVFSHF